MAIRHTSSTIATTTRLTRLIILATALAMTGCASSVKWRAGTPVRIDALGLNLTISESTAAEVAAELGTPYGTGKSMLPFQDAPRTLWTYYYEEGTVEDDRRIFLFVFLDDGIYDGYMWFSSLPDHLESGPFLGPQ
jgi:hypothetical protein